jgi:hypothetical protein
MSSTMVTLTDGLVLPLFGTPRDLSRETYGHEVGEVARRLGKPLLPWQQYAADVSQEIDPETGDLFYDEVVITVPRQSGKTTLILALLVWRCVVFAQRLGVEQTCTYLAQTGRMAAKKLERELARLIRRSNSFVEIPKNSRARPVRANEWKYHGTTGSEHIVFGTESYVQVAAPTETGSHGDVLDVAVIDEAFAHVDDTAEQAVDAATVTRLSPQSIVVSTVGNARSRFLWNKVQAGRRRCRAGSAGSRTCYLEWGIPIEETGWDDPEVWARYLPALGHTITVARLCARLAKARSNPDAKDDEGFEPGEKGFRRGYLNQWIDRPPDESTPVRVPEIGVAVWADRVDVGSQVVGRYVIGVAASESGATASIVVAGRNADGVVHVETTDHQGSVRLWLEHRLREMLDAEVPASVVFVANSPEAVFIPEIYRAVDGRCPVEKLTQRNYALGCESFKQAVIEDRVRHVGDVFLAASLLGGFRRDVSGGWVWDAVEATADITPLRAATAAFWVLETLPPVEVATKPFFIFG